MFSVMTSSIKRYYKSIIDNNLLIKSRQKIIRLFVNPCLRQLSLQYAITFFVTVVRILGFFTILSTKYFSHDSDIKILLVRAIIFR